MIFDLLALACLAHLVVDFIVTVDKKDVLQMKPFKCDMCMGFYISVVPLFVTNGLYGIAYAAAVGVLADLIYRIKQSI